MTLKEAIDMFVGQDGYRHILEVSLSDIREWNAENEMLRAALQEIEREATAWKRPRYSWFGERARRALENKP